jgi:acyl-coenzyme A thioesterase PaaI-like protein
MKQVQFILSRAKTSPFYLWVLNRLLWRLIPFNGPHKVTIDSISDSAVTIRLPYIRKNQNHLKGMHAFALGTLCEYACGIGLMITLDPKQYRIILKEVKIDYLRQAKGDVFASFGLDPVELEQTILHPLNETGIITKMFEVTATDADGKEICKGEITWQLKSWEKVKHKVS